MRNGRPEYCAEHPAAGPMARLALRLYHLNEDKLSKRQRYVVSIYAFETDVTNGGFAQLVGNKPYMIESVLEALHAIGA